MASSQTSFNSTFKAERFFLREYSSDIIKSNKESTNQDPFGFFRFYWEDSPFFDFLSGCAAAVGKMPANEKTKKVVNLKSMCICTDCPTYTICAKKAIEGLFCWLTEPSFASRRIIDCLCPSCLVTSKGGGAARFLLHKGLG